MKKTLIKSSIFVSALIAIALIPSNSQLSFGYGGDNSAGTAPTCGSEKPDQVVLYEPNHSLLPKATKPGDVRLNWLKANKADKYTVAFGTASGKYIYGLPDVGNTTNFTVSHLTRGKKYYFVVRGVNGCMPGPWSREWAVTVGGSAGGAVTALNTNTQRVVTPPNIPPTLPPAGTAPKDVQNNAPANNQPGTPAQQPQTYVPPAPAPQQTGFFGGLWKGFMGIFGR